MSVSRRPSLLLAVAATSTIGPLPTCCRAADSPDGDDASLAAADEDGSLARQFAVSEYYVDVIFVVVILAILFFFNGLPAFGLDFLNFGGGTTAASADAVVVREDVTANTTVTDHVPYGYHVVTAIDNAAEKYEKDDDSEEEKEEEAVEAASAAKPKVLDMSEGRRLLEKVLKDRSALQTLDESEKKAVMMALEEEKQKLASPTTTASTGTTNKPTRTTPSGSSSGDGFAYKPVPWSFSEPGLFSKSRNAVEEEESERSRSARSLFFGTASSDVERQLPLSLISLLGLLLLLFHSFLAVQRHLAEKAAGNDDGLADKSATFIRMVEAATHDLISDFSAGGLENDLSRSQTPATAPPTMTTPATTTTFTATPSTHGDTKSPLWHVELDTAGGQNALGGGGGGVDGGDALIVEAVPAGGHDFIGTPTSKYKLVASSPSSSSPTARPWVVFSALELEDAAPDEASRSHVPAAAAAATTNASPVARRRVHGGPAVGKDSVRNVMSALRKSDRLGMAAVATEEAEQEGEKELWQLLGKKKR